MNTIRQEIKKMVAGQGEASVASEPACPPIECHPNSPHLTTPLQAGTEALRRYHSETLGDELSVSLSELMAWADDEEVED